MSAALPDLCAELGTEPTRELLYLLHLTPLVIVMGLPYVTLSFSSMPISLGDTVFGYPLQYFPRQPHLNSDFLKCFDNIVLFLLA